MNEPTEQDIAIAKRTRTVALVMAGAGLLSIAAPWLVTTFGLQPRFEFLFYMIALAAFFWSLVVVAQIWQKTRK
ncbi:DUF5337 domain-containing protein [Algirhabdus cladophorae]|uniref:DUF5337 domain-containing protein n=1 Tax=Algirhabdus cladophorae TaxID=3377108 RepID=UPI003B848F90